MHGAGGEWRVERQRLSWPILDAFRDAAEELGIPKTDDFNAGDNEGSGYFEVNQRGGLRWNTTKAFLRPALKRRNLRVVTGAEVERLEFDGKRAARVRYRPAGQSPCCTCRGEKSSFRQERSTRRKSSNFRGLATPKSCRAQGSTPPRTSRRRWQPAGPSANSHGVPHRRCEDAEPALPQSFFACRHGTGVSFPPIRATFDGAEPARHFCQERSGIDDTRSRISRPAAQHRSAWRALAPLSCRHCLGLQSAAGKPGDCAYFRPETRACRRKSGRIISRRSVIDCLPHRSIRHARNSHGDKSDDEIPAAGDAAWHAVSERRGIDTSCRRHRDDDLSSGRNLQDGQ